MPDRVRHDKPTPAHSEPAPAAAQRLDQRHRRDLAIRLRLDQRAAGVQRGHLRGDDLGVADLAGPVAVEDLLLDQVGGVATPAGAAPACSLQDARRRRAGPRRPGTPSARSGDSAPTAASQRRRAAPSTRAPVAPASNTVCATEAPSDHSSADGAEQVADARPRRCRASRSGAGSGKYADRSMPICSLAAATWRSAEAMSGRRCSSVDGTPSGHRRHARASSGAGASVEVGRRLADQHGDRVLEARALALQRASRSARVVGELGLRLQHVGLRRRCRRRSGSA